MSAGRQRSRADIGQAAAAWFGQHVQALLFSTGQMFRNPVGSLLTVAVIGISLALPAAFYLLLVNSERVIDSWGGNAHITLFLKMDVPGKRAAELAQQLRDRPGIVGVRHVTPGEALAEFRQASGFGHAIDQLGENPLPAVLLVRPADSVPGDGAESLLAELGALPEVDLARFDRQWIQRLVAMLAIMHRAVQILGALLALAVLLIIGNTIRLSIYNRRTEIEINMLFGATNAFIQRPFLYSGFMHGLAGALLAWLLVSAAVLLLQAPVTRLAELYASDFTLAGLGTVPTLKLLALGGLLGVLGSWAAVQRHLRDITPF